MLHLLTILPYLREGPSQSLQLWQLEQLFYLQLRILRQLRVVIQLGLPPLIEGTVQEAAVVGGHKFA